MCAIDSRLDVLRRRQKKVELGTMLPEVRSVFVRLNKGRAQVFAELVVYWGHTAAIFFQTWVTAQPAHNL